MKRRRRNWKKRSRRQKDLPRLPDGHPIEQASEADRQWFASHPGESRRIRKAIPGEFDGSPFRPELSSEFASMGRCDYVEVVEVEPGFRLRLPWRHIVKTEGSESIQ